MAVPFERKILAGFVLSISVVATLMVASYQANREYVESGKWIHHTHKVLQSLEEVFSCTKDAETAQRGFLITGDERYLDPYQESKYVLPVRVGELGSLVADNPRQSANFKELFRELSIKFDILDEGIRLRKAQGFEVSSRTVILGDGKKHMGNIRTLIKDMKLIENGLLREREKRLEDNSRIQVVLNIIGALGVFSLLIGIYFLLQSEIRRRNQVAAELDANNNWLNTVVSGMGQALVAMDKELRVLRWNKAAEKLYGFTEREVLGKDVRMLLKIEGIDPNKESALRDVLYREGEIKFDSTHFSKEGKSITVFSTITLIKDSSGALLGLLAVVEDLGPRLDAEREIRESNIFLSTILENIPNMIFVKEAKDLRFVRLNKAGEELLGYSRTEMLGMNDFDFFPKEQAEFFTQRDREVLNDGQMQDTPEEPINTRYHGQRWLHTKKIPILGEKNNPQYLLGISEDITELKKQRDAINQMNRDLEAFSYSVSHDLRAPLSGIQGIMQILEMQYGSQLDAEGLKLISMVRGTADSMASLIQNLLSFARLGSQQIERSNVNMDEIAREAFEQVKQNMPQSKATLVVHPLGSVEGDEPMLRQVLMNLFSNALKYSAKREDEARVEIGVEDKDGEKVFYVRDNGVGFDMKNIDKLFSVFSRLHLKSEFEGNGVGLAIVAMIITKHGGKAWAEGKVGEGATFYFTLPAL